MTKTLSLIVSLILSGFLIAFALYARFAAEMGGDKALYNSITVILLIGAILFIVHAVKNFKSKP